MSPVRSGEERVLTSGDVEWNLDVTLHPAQIEIWEDQSRFQVVAAGRRFGKTMLAAVKAIRAAASKPDAEVLWVSPSHKQSRLAMRWIAKQIPALARSVNQTFMEIHLASGGRIQFRTAENPDSLRGEGWDFAVLDEASYIDQRVWTQAIRPALADRQGGAFFISTFNGENWFFDLWQTAQLPKYKGEWAAFMFPSTANPWFPPSEIETARGTMSKDEVEQEFFCSPIAFKGAVFDQHAVMESIAKGRSWVHPGPGPHDAGLDWGWQVTALEVCRPTTNGEVVWVYEELFLQSGLEERCNRIAEVCSHLSVGVIYTDAADPTANFALARTLNDLGLATYVQPMLFQHFKVPGIRTRARYLSHGREILTEACPHAIKDTRAYKIDPLTDKPAKGSDHTVDAMTAYYAHLMDELGAVSLDEEEDDGTIAA